MPQTWVEESLAFDPVAGAVHTTDGWVHRGKYEWFRTLDGRAYFAKGYHGQYVFVVPDAHTVFVRFGEGYGDVDWCSLFLRLADEAAVASITNGVEQKDQKIRKGWGSSEHTGPLAGLRAESISTF